MEEEIDKIAHQTGKAAEVAKMEAAKVIGMMEPSSALIFHLAALLKDNSPEVRRYALESAGKIKMRSLVPLVIAQLKDPVTERVAAHALVEYGTKILGTLKDYLTDKDEDRRIKEAIPDIMFQIGTQRAADLMAMVLNDGRSLPESAIIDALFKLRTKDSEITFPLRHIEPKLLSAIKKSYLFLQEMHDLLMSEKKTTLVEDMEKDLSRSLKQIFELLSLIYPHEDILSAYQNISAGTKKSIAFSCELLENILRKEWRDFIFPLIDDIPFGEKVKRSKRMLKELEKTKTS
jgi:hypothetical protein